MEITFEGLGFIGIYKIGHVLWPSTLYLGNHGCYSIVRSCRMFGIQYQIVPDSYPKL